MSPSQVIDLIARLGKARRWINGTISHFVTDDDGSGVFVRGTGTELAGFDQQRTEADSAITDAITFLRAGPALHCQALSKKGESS